MWLGAPILYSHEDPMELPLEVTTRLNVLAAIMSLAILAVLVFGMVQRGTRLVGTAEGRAMSTARRRFVLGSSTRKAD